MKEISDLHSDRIDRKWKELKIIKMNEPFTEVSDDDYIDPMHDDRSDPDGCFRNALYLIGSLTLIACLIYFLIQLL